MGMLERKMLHGNAETLVLAMLAEEEHYGYRMRRELAAKSRHYFFVAFGRLYPLLGAMQRRGLVRSRWVRAGKSRQRKHYEITAKGRAELHERKLRWRQFCDAMDHVLRS